MKRVFLAAAILACLFFITGCDTSGNDAGANDAPALTTPVEPTSPYLTDATEAPPAESPTDPPMDEDDPMDAYDPNDASSADPTPPDAPIAHTLAQLSATIIAAGQFWEDWWAFEGLFTYSEGYGIFVPKDPNTPGTGMSFSPLLPASGLSNLNDVRNHLLQFYTDALVDAEMAHTFIEYDGVLHFANARAGFPRFDWTDATFTIIDETDESTIVEASVRHGYFILDPGGYVRLWFHMVNGRIDYVGGGSIVTATLDWWGSDGSNDYEVWDTFTVELSNGWLYVATATDLLLGSFTSLHEVDYMQLHGWEGDPWGDRLVIWSSMPLFELELMGVVADMLGDDFVYIPLNRYGRVDALLPGEGFLLTNYIGMGTLPWSGITFVDEAGNRYHFWLQHDHSDSSNRFFLGQFTDRSDELPDGWEAYGRPNR